MKVFLLLETLKWDKQLAECFYCFENRKVPKHLVMALGEYTYLMLCGTSLNFNELKCIIELTERFNQ
jgi:hypothetical protein